MAMTPEQARQVTDARLLVLNNIKNERPIAEGINKDLLREALAIVRKDRNIGVMGSGKATKAKASPVIPLDLNALVADHRKK